MSCHIWNIELRHGSTIIEASMETANPAISMETGFDPRSENRALEALAALAQSSRLRIFRQLVGAADNGLHPGQISSTLAIPANALSFHLRELHSCGLVSHEREGRFLRYRANMKVMTQLMTFLMAHCCHGKPCAGMPATGYSMIAD